MRIINGSVAMEGYSQTIETKESRTELLITGSPKGLSKQNPLEVDYGDTLNLSKEGKDLSETIQSTQTQKPKNDWPLQYALNEKDMEKIRLLERIIEQLTGKPFKFRYLGMDLRSEDQSNLGTTDLRDKLIQAQPIQRLGWGISFHHAETVYQSETSSFSTSGKVTTEDGREIEFNLNYLAQNEYMSSQQISFKAGDALIDPLVLRLDSNPMTYSNDKVSFDLNLDKKTDSFRVPVDNAGFLFIDLDQNGKVTDGSELFGPQSGSGFSELAKLDSDQNGWIDEADTAYNNLRIWIHSSDGSDKVLGLAEAGVGALFVSGVAGGVSHRDENFQTLGKTKANGFYLKENGQAALVHEIDLVI